jgi:mRNA interferase HicA
MKRRALLSHLQEHGCSSVREGGSHSIWTNSKTGRREAIPRHNEIKKHLARSICKNLSVPIPPGD